MFSTMSLSQLQSYWWFLNSILAAILVFMSFIQGGESLLWQVAQNEDEKTLLVNILGRKWEISFTALVVWAVRCLPLFLSFMLLVLGELTLFGYLFC